MMLVKREKEKEASFQHLLIPPRRRRIFVASDVEAGWQQVSAGSHFDSRDNPGLTFGTFNGCDCKYLGSKAPVEEWRSLGDDVNGTQAADDFWPCSGAPLASRKAHQIFHVKVVTTLG